MPLTCSTCIDLFNPFFIKRQKIRCSLGFHLKNGCSVIISPCAATMWVAYYSLDCFHGNQQFFWRSVLVKPLPFNVFIKTGANDSVVNEILNRVLPSCRSHPGRLGCVYFVLWCDDIMWSCCFYWRQG